MISPTTRDGVEALDDAGGEDPVAVCGAERQPENGEDQRFLHRVSALRARMKRKPSEQLLEQSMQRVRECGARGVPRADHQSFFRAERLAAASELA